MTTAVSPAMPPLNGVLLDLATIDQGDLDLSSLDRTNVHWQRHDYTEPADTLERIRHAQILVTNKVALDRFTLAGAEGLRLVCIAATGTNNVDLIYVIVLFFLND